MSVFLQSFDPTVEWTSVEFHSHTNSTPTRTGRKDSDSSSDDRSVEKTLLSEIRIDIAFDDLQKQERESFSASFGLCYCLIGVLVRIGEPRRILFSLVLNSIEFSVFITLPIIESTLRFDSIDKD